MKVYISVDIEGIAGIAHDDETSKSHADYPEFREEMTREALAACEGAMAAGAREIFVKDAHGSGRNILVERLPECARIVRGWSGHPLSMVQELDASFDAILFIGYHSRAGAETNPLARTLSSEVASIKLNGTFDIDSCLGCHAFAPSFRAVEAHQDPDLQKQLLSREMGCTGICHPAAHPEAALTGGGAP